MRILVVSHAPLKREFGGAQTGINLAEALQGLGHDVTGWSPEPLPRAGRWSSHSRLQRQAIERFVRQRGPFDVIDTQAISASREVSRSAGCLVVRSVQPELRYLASNVRGEWAGRAGRAGSAGRKLPSLAGWLRIAQCGPQAVAVLRGWRRADRILCLGSLELDWMRRRFPGWSTKLGSYVCAPSAEERRGLVAVRQARRAGSGRAGTRFLWIGRWAEHKGIGILQRFLAERAANHSEDTFTIAGCGSQAAAALPAEAVRAGRIRVVPWFERAELPQLLAAHDAGLFTSTVEGWGITLNEMLESGMPVYATEAGGVGDLRPFFPESLLPFPPPANDPPGLVAASPGPEYFERFDWTAVARAYAQSVSPA